MNQNTASLIINEYNRFGISLIYNICWASDKTFQVVYSLGHSS